MSDPLLPPGERPDIRRQDLSRYPFVHEMEPRWGDMDSLRHLNNVALNRFYEEGRLRFMGRLREQAGVSLRGVVVAVHVDYLHEGRYPVPLQVGVGVAEVGRSTLRFAQALFQEQRCIGVASATMVCLGDGSSGPQPVPEPWHPVLDRVRVRTDDGPAA